MNKQKIILPVIVLSQFFCTSLWFAGNGVLPALTEHFHLGPGFLGHITSSVQLGFIIGTLLFAFLTIADRFSPSKVFLACSILGALFNLGIIIETNNTLSLLTFRFLTGFFIAGIYPVGMKIAADYFDKGLGVSLGFLVGALNVGTAFPHLISGFSSDVNWKMVLILTSLFAVLGGMLMFLFVPNGPYRKASTKLDLSALFLVFKNKNVRSSALGYFGHMWELYAFWAFVPVMITTYNAMHPASMLNVPLLSFSVIAIGGIGCVIGGYLSLSHGSKIVATIALYLSGIFCLISPFIFSFDSKFIFAGILLGWGTVVSPDSPQFSTLVARNANSEIKGTSLTIINSIGFFITIISIQLLNSLQEYMNPRYLYIILALGPALGILALREKKTATKI